MTSTKADNQYVIHADLPKATGLAGSMLEPGAVILLDSDPTSETGEVWLGEVDHFELDGDYIKIVLDYGQVAVVEIAKASVVVLHEADPKKAVARSMERAQ